MSLLTSSKCIWIERALFSFFILQKSCSLGGISYRKVPKAVTEIENDDEDEDTYRQMVEEAFAADDVVADFE